MPCHYTLASIARELICGGHPGRAKVLYDADERLCTLERDRMKVQNIFERMEKEIAELRTWKENSILVDAGDRAILARFNDNGDPVAAPPVTAEELTAELKTSADALNGAIADAGNG